MKTDPVDIYRNDVYARAVLAMKRTAARAARKAANRARYHRQYARRAP